MTVHFLVEIKLFVYYLLVNGLCILSIKWQKLSQHDVDDDGCTPNVDFFIIWYPLNNLRSQVMLAAKHLCKFMVFLELFGKAKVNQFYVYIAIAVNVVNHDVVWLYVAMRYLVLMEIVDS